MPILARPLPQHSLDQLADHGEPERIGLPSCQLHGVEKLRLAKQDFGVMAGARPRILVDPFLHQEGGALVDEYGEARPVVDARRPTPQKVEPAHRLLPESPPITGTPGIALT